jgi:hypothetical protein
MKTIFLLSALVVLSSCSKSPRNKSPGVSGAPRFDSTTPISDPSIQPVEVDQDQNQGQNDQTQDGDFRLRTTYTGPNVTLKYPSAKAEGKIIIRDKDAARLYKRLAIKEEKRGEGKAKVSFKVAKNIECSEEECVMKINYKDGEVLANAEDKIGPHKGKFLPSLLTYNGENLKIIGRKKDAFITVTGKDAEALFYSMQVGESSSSEGEKIVGIKAGAGEAPITCKNEKGAQRKDDVITCSVKLHAANGVVEIP